MGSGSGSSELRRDRDVTPRPRIAIHKFASCDGCQLAFLNAGEVLLDLAARVQFVHFAEAGIVNPDAEADVAFIEGSISTPGDVARIRDIRTRSGILITIGICATAGGLQALRNGAADFPSWVSGQYSKPEFIHSLSTSTPISEHVKVDLEISGCPVSAREVFAVLADLLAGVAPRVQNEPVCVECKRAGHICVVVARGQPCLGPVTRTGCGAICPGAGRGCYGCFGPSAMRNLRVLEQVQAHPAFLVGARHR